MQPSVLQSVERRRRPKRRRRLLGLALLAGAGTALGLYLTGTFDGQEPARAQQPAPSGRFARMSHQPQPLLTEAYRPVALRIRAKAAILVNERNGAAFWAKRPHRSLPIASTTKIMTAVVVLEHLGWEQRIRIAPIVPRAAPIREGLRAGERVPIWKLMYGLMLYSGNDDALALAIGTAGSRDRFIDLMNAKARKLELLDSHFSTPSGVVDRDNYSSASDLAALTRYAMRKPAFRNVVKTPIAHVRWAAPTYAKVYVNKNDLLRTYRGANGVKTGWTTIAGHCLVASARRGRASLIAVVLGSPDPYRDARRLLNYGFRSLPH
jgi:serine-type D-Ala-D-Ala carboxypeptidase (penicillin-binding protein 5/6)